MRECVRLLFLGDDTLETPHVLCRFLIRNKIALIYPSGELHFFTSSPCLIRWMAELELAMPGVGVSLEYSTPTVSHIPLYMLL
jgi:hypothetical protein